MTELRNKNKPKLDACFVKNGVSARDLEIAIKTALILEDRYLEISGVSPDPAESEAFARAANIARQFIDACQRGMS